MINLNDLFPACTTVCGCEEQELEPIGHILRPDIDDGGEIRIARAHASQPGRFPNLGFPDKVPPMLPRGFQLYSSVPDQALLGVPLREGKMLQLASNERVRDVNLALYVNGVSLSGSDGAEMSVVLSPFSYVRTCRFQSGPYKALKSFKISVLDQDACCYLAVKNEQDQEAEDERLEWVLSISHTILLVTDSLLPRVTITCEPVEGNADTKRRLLAGYMLHRESHDYVSVVYCELMAHEGGYARFTMYENEECLHIINCIFITEFTVSCDIVAVNCCCFVLDQHQFAVLTPSERQLWRRAVNNTKVKLQNKAPDPTEAEIFHFRIGIRERISRLQASQGDRTMRDPVLSKGPRCMSMGGFSSPMPTPSHAVSSAHPPEPLSKEETDWTLAAEATRTSSHGDESPHDVVEEEAEKPLRVPPRKPISPVSL
mmetsp:Transcript_64499/g.154025  ORF Transcript_64499/g.154025 Transcript_64499/m.154025 type:complete len:429 (-) Transcript_64499:97-1383(-)|eukprot:CAMPEP_0178416348 /NCGR_PEP_ID=MMETSP0689_2-20121128/24019_1 /TAXON_ID=160604 /ORGANISM="Amphidinium massartii, Strain CS-259" /LENGTH=428 /DNA_ID=CAMNT_0020037693 /DNA_START=115 /DNA_END=1401 /DNA_ORIENTATION=+